MVSEGTSSLNPTSPNRLDGGKERENRERKGKRKRERKNSRERGSTFSLDFLVIGLSNPSETRGKVDPHCKSYAWVLVLWSFDNSGR